MSSTIEATPVTTTTTPVTPVTESTAPVTPTSATWWDRIVNFKKDLGLRAPGSFDAVDREIRDISVDHLLTNGAKMTMEKGIGENLAVGHEYKIGTGPRTNPSTFNYTAIYHSKELMMQGKLDGKGNLNGIMVNNWAKWLSTRIDFNRAKNNGQEMFGVNLSADYTGTDYDLGLKLQQPNPLDGTGALSVSLLQSITSRFALGATYQHAQQTADMGESTVAYVARYKGSDWTATASMSPMGADATYYHHLSDNLSLGTTLRTGLNMQTGRPETSTAVHVKGQFLQHEVTSQLDTQGKMATNMLVGITPQLFLNLSGDVDHSTSLGKFGMGLMMRG